MNSNTTPPKQVPACIRACQPSCPFVAVIPAVTVSSTEQMQNLADCFVHVTDINTTFYIDERHRIMITWAGPIEQDNYDFAANPLNLRSQTVYDFATNTGAYYNAAGEYRTFQLLTQGD